MKTVSISVALATYNGKEYLHEQLDSILNQTYPITELVVCDDNSTDETYEILEEYSRRYEDKVKIIQNPQHLGVSKNFENAISQTTGDVIFLADQDDVWEPEKVEKMVHLILCSSNIGGVFSDSAIVDKDLNDKGRTHFGARGFSGEKIISFLTGVGQLDFFLKRVPAAGHDMAFLSSEKINLLPFPYLPQCHDTWIGLSIAVQHKWAFTGEKLTKFRQHNHNLSGVGKKRTLSSSLQEARQSIKDNSFLWNSRIYEQLIKRLGENCDKEVLNSLNSRMEYSMNRASMNVNIFSRLPKIFHEIKTGRYFQYGRGMVSIIQDLLLRKPW